MINMGDNREISYIFHVMRNARPFYKKS